QDVNTPCYINGSCIDCTSPESICAYMVTTRISRPAKKIKGNNLVGENLGL
ncbi:lactate utilization protein, partial [Clostridioides difficile]